MVLPPQVEMGREDLKSKPEAVRAKIVEGRLDKIKRQYALMEQVRARARVFCGHTYLSCKSRACVLRRGFLIDRLGSLLGAPSAWASARPQAISPPPAHTPLPSRTPLPSESPHQPALRDNNKTVTEIIKETIAAVGENIQVGACA